MVQLRILCSNGTGQAYDLCRFPCVVGRSASADLRIEEPGIWDRHLQIELGPDAKFTATVLPEAHAQLNGSQFEQATLKNGDVIDAGAVKLQFYLSPTQQRSLRLREALTWVALALLCAGQVALVYLLVQE
jgi:hypothetical protein